MKRLRAPWKPIFLLLAVFAVAAASAGESNNLRELRQKAAKGDASAMTDIGYAYFTGGEGLEKDQAEAVRWFEKAANAGNIHAMNNLGIAYQDGVGVEQDDLESLKWFKKAAENGHEKAQWSVGRIYRLGIGVERDFQKALEWYTMSAENGFLPALRDIAATYLEMHGENENPEHLAESVKWMRKAALLGDGTAQFNMGVFYHNGEGVAEDRAEAARWHEKAARNGVAMSQFHLADYYKDGVGRKKDLSRAKRWYTEALKNGVDKAAAKLAQIPGDVVEATDEPTPVGLTKLLADYAANPGAADNRYLDEFLAITDDHEGGEVSMSGDSVTVIPGGSSLGILCRFAPAPGGRNIHSGPGVVYRGFCRGLVDKTIILDDCVTLPAPEEKSVSTSRADAAKKVAAAKTDKLAPRTAPPKGKPSLGKSDRKNRADADLSGIWTGEATMDGETETGEIAITLRRRGGGYDGDLVFDNTSGVITEAVIDGQTATMSGFVVLDGEKLAIAIEARVIRNRLSGSIDIQDADEDSLATITFDAARSAPATAATTEAPPTPAAKKKKGGLSGRMGGKSADPLAGAWEGTYIEDGESDTYRIRIDREAGLELLDEELAAPVTEARLADGIATMKAAWTSDDDATSYEASFSGALSGARWTGVVVLTSDGEEIFRGKFELTKPR